MMKKKIAGIVLAVSVAGGVGTGVVANALTTESPGPGPAPSTQAIVAPGDLVLAPGAVGPITVGMSKADAVGTGYFVADVASPADGCPARPLSWRDEYLDAYDVHTLGNGEIVSIGVWGTGARTADGVGVGSRYRQVRDAYPGEELVEAGYGQSGVRYFDGEDGGWIGFLFDEPVDEVDAASRVTFVEVTKGTEPSLMRDGC